ncbi:hypothetical protein TCAL_06889 [Tigriopus californicus]|uniref:Large ribosomal subunit protein mL62 n=1 Tax=Tigriopus californicus TaxID=6832 RepID=A0A553PMI4_TIGCA|nr:hypothetical protein TCAL_06889 [Tigriopus californicus]|eukprot:TCALIF_06889-PA protein Name:"Similar to ICT1 Peptidyl-tRNA hydrolase ICT1, mitochondrial (Bos taurus)" AED:0.08 eAED:0.08 QI:0/-1/0/1/-1/1/1/0/185
MLIHARYKFYRTFWPYCLAYPKQTQIFPFNIHLDLSSKSLKLPDLFKRDIPVKELQFSYTHSSGPGGQNVNKVNSKVELRFHVDSAKWMDEDTKHKFKNRFQSLITGEGYFIVRSEKTRSQSQNQADAISKLRTNINVALTPEPAKFTEEELKSIESGKKRFKKVTLMDKRRRSIVKKDRKYSDW